MIGIGIVIAIEIDSQRTYSKPIPIPTSFLIYAETRK